MKTGKGCKQMAKYIIEIEDEPVNGLYIAKGFHTLVFDEEGLRRLKKVEYEVEKELAGNAYYYITDGLEISTAWDEGTEEDMMRREVRNYFKTSQAAFTTLNRICEFMNAPSGRDTEKKDDHFRSYATFEGCK